jgi:fatty-acyl-CoA synthase
VLYGVPTMFIGELGYADFNKYDFSSLRTGVMAGSPCPVQVMRQVIDLMNMKDVEICYGMTETSPVSFQTHLDDPIEKRVGTPSVRFIRMLRSRSLNRQLVRS